MGEKLDDYYCDEDVAGFLHWKKSTLVKNRCLGKNHPPFIRVGRTVLYPVKAFKEWMESMRIHKEIKCNDR